MFINQTKQIEKYMNHGLDADKMTSNEVTKSTASVLDF
jgi:hypothetical protein